MKRTHSIALTRGKVALVDASDFDRLAAFKWSAVRTSSGIWYASRSSRGRAILMHRAVLTTAAPHIDHINGDGLDNRRSNLRPCSVRQNLANSRRSKANTSGFKGVSFHKKTGKWRAYIAVGRRQTFLGYFTDKRDAAAAYDLAAMMYFGEFARLNIAECA